MGDHDSAGHVVAARAEQTYRVGPRSAWPELLTALKECQESLPSTEASLLTRTILNYLVEKVGSHTPSSDQYASQLSSDARKPRVLRNKNSSSTWWFRDLVFLNIHFVEKLTKTMISRELDHGVVSKFLFFYRNSKSSSAKPAEKREISESVIALLCLLDGRSIPFNGLFNVYRAASIEKVSKKHRNMLESLIGSQLDQATLDYLLVPSPRGKNYIYDVNMVLKLVKSFLRIVDLCRFPASRLNKVGRLMDSYLSEVASDSRMKHSKFSELVMTLPDCARESHDGLYQAMDLYLEVHHELCEEAKMSLCCALNYEKLSKESLKHLAGNSKFPSSISVRAFMARSNNKLTSLIREIYHLKSFSGQSWFHDTANEADKEHRFDANSRELVRRNGVELSEFCGAAPPEMACSRTSRMSASGRGRYLPKLCGC